MYEAYWKLRHSPFESNADAGFFYESETHQSALLKLRYLVENRKGGGLLVGGGGFGKSYLLQVLTMTLKDRGGPVIPVLFPQMSAAELMAYIAAELGGNSEHTSEPPSLDRTIRLIQDLL